MPKVFVIQEVLGRDISPALKYGELVYLLPRGDWTGDLGPVADHIKNKISHISDNDWLLMMGDPTLIALVAALVYDKTKGVLNLLKWDKLSTEYHPLSYVDLEKTTEILK